MSEKFLNKYRIDSIRLKNWDYSSPGYYFVTICTKDREFYFGDIKNNKMILSDMGKIAYDYWLEIPEHFPHVKLDEFIVMPNHLHGIIKIMKRVGVFCRDAIETIDGIYGCKKREGSVGRYDSL